MKDLKDEIHNGNIFIVMMLFQCQINGNSKFFFKILLHFRIISFDNHFFLKKKINFSPWFAAWDLAFHCIPFATIDPEFAKRQLTLMLREWYMNPNGQIPAYEWAFGYFFFFFFFFLKKIRD